LRMATMLHISGPVMMANENCSAAQNQSKVQLSSVADTCLVDGMQGAGKPQLQHPAVPC
jgi:hypothetical protein